MRVEREVCIANGTKVQFISILKKEEIFVPSCAGYAKSRA